MIPTATASGRVRTAETHLPSGCAILHVSGAVDEETGSQLQQTLTSLIGEGYRDFILEMSGADKIGPRLVDCILAAHKQFGAERGRIALAGCPFALQSEVCALMHRHSAALHRRPLVMFHTIEEARRTLIQTSRIVLDPLVANSAPLRKWLRSIAPDIEVSDSEAIEAATSEAFNNAVAHASPGRDCAITVRATVGSVFTVEVEDCGQGFEARQYFMVDPDALHLGARGLGIFVMRNLMDQVEFIVQGTDDGGDSTGTIVRLTKRLLAPRSTKKHDP